MLGVVSADNKSQSVSLTGSSPMGKVERKKGTHEGSITGVSHGIVKHGKNTIFIMLKLKMSGLLAGMNGKLGGSKVFKGAHDTLLVNITRPKNRNTAAQASIRADMRSMAATWRTLTEAQRLAWNSFGSTMSRKNKLGTAHKSAGFNAFIAENQRNQFVAPGAAVVTNPYPSNPVITPLNCANPVAVGGATPSLVIDVPLIPTGQVLVLYGTPPESAGRYNVKGQYHPFTTFVAGAAVPAKDILGVYTGTFGTPVTGKKIYFQWETVLLSGSKIDKLYGDESAVAVIS